MLNEHDQLSPVYPPIGAFIDGGTLQLVEVLDKGGQGVVYRAIETRASTEVPKSYSVKCLVSPHSPTSPQRQVIVCEIAFHQLASRHPGVITLHRVIESVKLTYIVMDYAPDHNLYIQITQNCRYRGDDGLIKRIFLQLLDAVEYCHSLGIYHRDLNPENILCFDDGLRIAITGFGLATGEKVSGDFEIGTVSHMSPECHGAQFAPHGSYSPMHNDIWSLGIILLNIVTGRSPWNLATVDDSAFQAYLQNPNTFLPSVLPISSEVNNILVGMFAVDHMRRTPLRAVRHKIQDVISFYSDGVIFGGSMALCPWESGMDIDSDFFEDTDHSLPRSSSPIHEVFASRRSKDSTSDIVFRVPSEDEVTTRLTRMLASVLQNPKSRKALCALQGGQAQLMVEYLHEQSSSTNNPIPWLPKHSLIALYRLSKSSLLYPHCYVLKAIGIDSHECGGGFSDIFKGHYGDQHVCLKVVRLHQKADIDALLKIYAKEAILWGQLRHRNVVPFYGVYYFNEERRQICLVSPWMNNGNLIQYLKNNPLTTVRAPFVHDITAGLEYLHGQSLIHSDLKGVNVLVNDAEIACITDFGLSFIRTDQTLAYTSIVTAAHGVSHNWAAPELLEDDQFPTMASDVWALGCVFYEILTGKPPYHGLSEAQVIRKLIAGATPQPPDASDVKVSNGAAAIWALIQKCLVIEPEERPTCRQILASLVSEGLTRLEGTHLTENDMHSGRLRFEKAMKTSQEISIDYVAVEDILGTISRANRNDKTVDPNMDGNRAGMGARRGKETYRDGKQSRDSKSEDSSRASVGGVGGGSVAAQEILEESSSTSSISFMKNQLSVDRFEPQDIPILPLPLLSKRFRRSRVPYCSIP